MTQHTTELKRSASPEVRVGVAEWHVADGWNIQDRPTCNTGIAESFENVVDTIVEAETRFMQDRREFLRFTIVTEMDRNTWPIGDIVKSTSNLCRVVLRSERGQPYRKDHSAFTLEVILLRKCLLRQMDRGTVHDLERNEAPSTEPLAREAALLREAFARRIKMHTTDDISDLEEANDTIAPIRAAIREYLQSVLRAHKLPRRPSLVDGKQAVKQINDLLANYGFRIRLPGTSVGASLGYGVIGLAKPGGYYLSAVVEGKPQKKYCSEELLAQLEIMPAGPSVQCRQSRSSS